MKEKTREEINQEIMNQISKIINMQSFNASQIDKIRKDANSKLLANLDRFKTAHNISLKKANSKLRANLKRIKKAHNISLKRALDARRKLTKRSKQDIKNRNAKIGRLHDKINSSRIWRR